MKKTHYLFALLAAALLAGCGGGGSTDTAPTSPTSPTAPTAPSEPVASTVTNPLTGAPAPGAPTTLLNGMAVQGATVTAYAVQPDGSSGAALGPSSQVTSAGGEFTLTLDKAPTSWVRVVARGGFITRNVDNTTRHPVTAMELVTPMVTTQFNHFVLNPMTDVAARILAHKAQGGATLAAAFTEGMQRTLALDMANLVLSGDASVHLNMLRGAIKSDVRYYDVQSDGRELMTGIERLGVMYDLPANEVWRVVAAVGANGYALSQKDSAGRDVQVGSWTGTTFQPDAPGTLAGLLNANTPDDMKVVDPATGIRVAPRLSDLVGRYLLLEFYVDHACATGATSSLTTRYPYYTLGSNGQPTAAACTDARRWVGLFQDRLLASKSGQAYK
jgi:hypothetical protein